MVSNTTKSSQDTSPRLLVSATRKSVPNWFRPILLRSPFGAIAFTNWSLFKYLEMTTAPQLAAGRGRARAYKNEDVLGPVQNGLRVRVERPPPPLQLVLRDGDDAFYGLDGGRGARGRGRTLRITVDGREYTRKAERKHDGWIPKAAERKQSKWEQKLEVLWGYSLWKERLRRDAL